MSKKKTQEVYAILYKRQLLFEDYMLFLPCYFSKGIFDSEDRSFTDEVGYPYYECDNYDAVMSTQDLTFFYDITESDLLDMYPACDLDEAVGMFYENAKKTILIGHANVADSIVELCEIGYESIEDLSREFLYQRLDGGSTVTITKTQLESIICETDPAIMKKKLKDILGRLEFLDKMHEEKGIESFTTDISGKKFNFEQAPSSVLVTNVIANSQKQAARNVVIQQPIVKRNNLSSKEVSDFVTKSLVGQDEAVEDMISIIINNKNAIKPEEMIRPLLIGQTGSGKSLLFRLLGKILDVPVVFVDCNLLVQSGYEGQHIEDVLRNLYVLCDEDIEKAQRAIVFFDEIDKLANRGAGVSDVGVQQALLKFIEGNEYVIEVDKNTLNARNVVIDTSMMNIVAGGAFADLTSKKESLLGFEKQSTSSDDNVELKESDIVKYGMISELIGRFQLIQYNKVTEEMIRNQLSTSDISPIKIKQEYYLRNYNANIQFSEDYIARVCEESVKKQSGFRGAIKIVNQSLTKLSFALQSEPLGEKLVYITEETIDNPKVYKIAKK